MAIFSVVNLYLSCSRYVSVQTLCNVCISFFFENNTQTYFNYTWQNAFSDKMLRFQFIVIRYSDILIKNCYWSIRFIESFFYLVIFLTNNFFKTPYIHISAVLSYRHIARITCFTGCFRKQVFKVVEMKSHLLCRRIKQRLQRNRI